MKRTTAALAVLLACPVLAGPGPSKPAASPSPALTALVETERAFARMSVTQGRRAAFLAFFGDNALFFTPAPASARPLIEQWPAAISYTLDWEPRFGDIAEAGDLGYTTGPYARTSREADAKLVASGWYFTLWKKQPDAGWKVLIDAGIEAPSQGALRPTDFISHEVKGGKGNGDRGTLVAEDRSLCASIAAAGMNGSLLRVGDDTTIVYRDGATPMVGVATAKAFFDSRRGAMRCEPSKEELARSADLGYTYGPYSIDGARREAGYYLRVWRLHPAGWRLAADLTIPGQ